MFGIDASAAAKMLADEAALKLSPILSAAITQAVAELKTVLIGHTITFTITIK